MVKVLLAPALGAGIAVMLNSNTLTIFSAMVAAAISGGAIQAGADGALAIVGGDPLAHY